MYLCSSNALRVLHETWTGRFCAPCIIYPCNRLGHTMTQPAYRGTCAEDAAGHSECAKHRLTLPLTRGRGATFREIKNAPPYALRLSDTSCECTLRVCLQDVLRLLHSMRDAEEEYVARKKPDPIRSCQIVVGLSLSALS